MPHYVNNPVGGDTHIDPRADSGIRPYGSILQPAITRTVQEAGPYGGRNRRQRKQDDTAQFTFDFAHDIITA